MEDEIIPAKRGRKWTWLAGITVTFLVAASGVATAAIRYDVKHAQTVLPGVTVGGVAVGGLSYPDARATLRSSIEGPLDAPITISVGPDTYTVTARKLGMKTDLESKYGDLVDLNSSTPMMQRVWHRLAGSAVRRDLPVSRSVDRAKVESFVDELAKAVDTAPRDARMELVDGQLKIHTEVAGFKLDRKDAIGKLTQTAMAGGIKVVLDGESTAAALKRSDIKNAIVVKIGENKLYHYRSEELVKVYDVATGLARYPTPRGTFKVINKRFRPTWVNPAKYPGGWGANLPAKIGPGPGNPLGTRALDLNSPGIRIHGTSAEYSMGYNASHGCIRMRMAEVEELFELIPVGTPVLIVQSGPYRPLPSKLSARERNTIDPNGPTTGGTTTPSDPAPAPSPSATSGPLGL